MRAQYADHRTRLLAPVVDLEMNLKRDLENLSQIVAANSLEQRSRDYRMDRLLLPHASRRLLMVDEIFVYPTDTPHGPFEPSRNWLESLRDEQALFESARERSTNPEARHYLDEVIAGVAAQWSYESCILLDDPERLLERPLPRIYKDCVATPADKEGQP
jgi:hypothetical protein